MKNEKKLQLSALASGTIFLGSMGMGTGTINAMTDYTDLGSASEMRAGLLTANALNAFSSNTDIEFECGEGKCGEGKCGGKDKKTAKETKDTKATKASANENSEAGKEKSADESKMTEDKKSNKVSTEEKKTEGKATAPKN